MRPEAKALAGRLFDQAQEYGRQEALDRREMGLLATQADDHQYRREVCLNLAADAVILEEIMRALDVLTGRKGNGQ